MFEKIVVNQNINEEITSSALVITAYNNKGKLLDGKTFKVTDENQNLVINMVTNENGKAIISGLEKGEYFYEQTTESNDENKIDSEKHPFYITDENQIINKVIVNEE